MKKENTTSVAIVATKNNAETAKVEQTNNKPTAEKTTPVAPAPPATPTAKVGATPAKKAEPTTDPVKTQAETVLQLSKRIEELEEQLRKEPQSIEERIAYYQRKQQLTERYKALNAQIKHLKELRERVAEDNADVPDFSNDAEAFRLRFIAPSSPYNEKDILNISSASLINEVIDLLATKMQEKAMSLQTEIAA